MYCSRYVITIIHGLYRSDPFINGPTIQAVIGTRQTNLFVLFTVRNLPKAEGRTNIVTIKTSKCYSKKTSFFCLLPRGMSDPATRLSVLTSIIDIQGLPLYTTLCLPYRELPPTPLSPPPALALSSSLALSQHHRATFILFQACRHSIISNLKYQHPPEVLYVYLPNLVTCRHFNDSFLPSFLVS